MEPRKYEINSCQYKNLACWNFMATYMYLMIKNRQINKQDSNYQAKIIKEIKHIVFDQLTRIFLCTNILVSVEDLNRIYMPKLTVLNIAQNNTSCMKILRKGDWKKLISLHLYSNPTSEVSCINQAQLEDLEWITLDYFEEEKMIVGGSLCWIVKLQSQKFSKLSLKSQYRLNQNNVKLYLKKRWKNIRTSYP